MPPHDSGLGYAVPWLSDEKFQLPPEITQNEKLGKDSLETRKLRHEHLLSVANRTCPGASCSHTPVDFSAAVDPKINYGNSPLEVIRMINVLAKQPLVGFDAEFQGNTQLHHSNWKYTWAVFPVFKQDCCGPFVRLFQFSLPSGETYIVDIYKLFLRFKQDNPTSTLDYKSSEPLKFLPQQLVEFLENPEILKVGFGSQNDARALYVTFGINFAGVIDLSELWKSGRYATATNYNAGIRNSSMKVVTYFVLGYFQQPMHHDEFIPSREHAILANYFLKYAAQDSAISVMIAILFCACDRVDFSLGLLAADLKAYYQKKTVCFVAGKLFDPEKVAQSSPSVKRVNTEPMESDGESSDEDDPDLPHVPPDDEPIVQAMANAKITVDNRPPPEMSAEELVA